MRYRIRNLTPDTLIIALLFFLPLITFWPQTLGGRTLLPADNLYTFAPYATYAEPVGVPSPPDNALVSDMILQNLHWKAFIKDSLAAGDLPLWNPHQLSGVPFMAAGQPSTLYPLSAIYYLLPLDVAYGWFVVINLWLAGVMMYGFIRVLRLNRTAALLGAITYQHSGFFLASAVFPMMLGGVVWLPLLLLCTEYIIRARPLFGRPVVVPWVMIGAAALALNIFAGHVEITYYTILMTAYYGLLRVLHGYWAGRNTPGAARGWAGRFGWLVAMGSLGLAAGAVQFIPLYELVSTNWRAQGKTFSETLAFAHPLRDVVQFVMPNFYGSPAQHTYLDVFAWERVPVDFINALGQRQTNTEWGIKNYVEGALYLGILPLALAIYGLLDRAIQGRTRPDAGQPPYRAGFTGLALVGLTFMFGLPTYALIYYGLPGLNQAHTPFRWVYAVTVSVAVLAAFGWECLTTLSSYRLKRAFTWLLLAVGGVTLAGVGLSYALYDAITEPLVAQLLGSLAKADTAFPDARAFYSHLVVQVSIWGMITLLTGVIFGGMTYAVHRQRQRVRFEERRDYHGGRRGLWARFRPGVAEAVGMGAIMLLSMDLMIATAGFNPAADPAWLDFTPPVVEWLADQPGEWRYITLDDPSQPPMLPANVTWRYQLDDVRGYESIIPRPYVDYMRQLYPQVQLDFNRIAPLYTTYDHVGLNFDPRTALTDPRFHLLNIRYVVTHPSTDISDVDGYSLAYADEAARVWENANAAPRAFVVPNDCLSPDGVGTQCLPPLPANIQADTGRELIIGLRDDLPANPALVVSMAHFPGWRAYLQTPNGETRLALTRTEIFPVIDLTAAAPGDSVRLVYSPLSFQVGAFTSAIAVIIALFLLGVWGWRRFVVGNDTDDRALLARNSVAPVILNLFNRGIDFVLAFVVLRVLGPEDTGIYYYAVIVFVWFDIFTNFGLDVYLMREASRDRDRTRFLFVNTTVFRLILSGVGVGLLLGFIYARQAIVPDPFDTRGIIALVLLYLGLVPGSLSKGMTSLYYAYERAEYPAAVSTVTSISKAILGVIVLLLGFGIIGLAAVSIFNNFVTLAILMIAGRDMLRQPQAASNHNGPPTGLDTRLMRSMANESYPLMLNHFLATIFFQIDVVLLEALRGAAIVGKYSVGYRWLLALNVIPSFFTMALFPRLSRQAADDRAALRRNYRLSLKLLAAVVFPAAVLLTFLAGPLTLLLGGNEFMPEGAIALQIMVWSMPLGWMNSLTQYVLIALDRQRQLTWAFVGGVAFNIITNLIFIPMYGYRAAALTTIASEGILMIGFALLLRSEMRGVNMLGVLWRPAVAAGGMAAAMAAGYGLHPLTGVAAGVLVYPALWAALRPLDAEEWALVRPLLPGRLAQRAISYS